MAQDHKANAKNAGKRVIFGPPNPFEDHRTPLEIEAQDRAQQAVQSAESGGGMHRPSKAYPKKKKK